MLSRTTPQVAFGIVFSIGMVVACAFKLYLGAPLYGVPNQDLALWLLDLVVVYPIAVSALFELLTWRDDNWRVNLAQDDDGDGKTSIKEHMKVRFAFFLFRNRFIQSTHLTLFLSCK